MELHQLARVCRKHRLFFAADGARLPYCLNELRGSLECFDAVVVSGTKISRSPGSVAIFKDHFSADVRADFDFRVRESGHATDCAWYLAAPFLKPLTEGIAGALGRARQLNAILTKLGYKVLYHGTNLLFIALTEDEIKLTRSILPNAYVWHTNVGITAGKRLQTLRIAISPASTDEEIWAMRKLFRALRTK